MSQNPTYSSEQRQTYDEPRRNFCTKTSLAPTRIVVWLIILIALCAKTSVSNVQAQSTAENYGCLDVRGFDVGGTYDLTQGIFINQPAMKLPPPGHQQDFSPDGRYLAAASSDMGTNDQWVMSLVISSRDGRAKQTVTYSTPNLSANVVDFPIWSPDSRHVAVPMRLSNAQAVRFIIAEPDANQSQIIDVPDISQAEVVDEAVWSPDSRYLAVSVQAQAGDLKLPYFRSDLNLYTPAGNVIRHVVENAVGYLNAGGETSDYFQHYYWSSDGRFIYYVQFMPDEGQHFDLMRYDLKEKATLTLIKALSDFPVYRNDYQYALVRWDSGGSNVVGVVDLVKGTTLTLYTTKDAIDLKWIGSRVLVRGISAFMWANVDGSSQHVINILPAEFATQTISGPSAFPDWYHGIFEVSKDEHYLMLEAKTSLNGQSPYNNNDVRLDTWLVDLLSGQSQRFVGKGVLGFSPDSQLGLVYNDSGGRLYLILPAQGKLTAIILSDEEMWHGFHAGISQIVWSPDNSRFVIVPYMGGIIDLIGRNAVRLGHYENFPGFYNNVPIVNWANCH